MIIAPVARPLRDYQYQAIQSTLRLATAGFRGYYSLPTGTGKTRVFTGLVEHYSKIGRVLIVAHRTELISQAADALRSDIPGIDVGVCMAERNGYFSQIVVGSIQTLQESRLTQVLLGSPGLFDSDYVGEFVAVIFDECHHLTADNSYSALINQVSQAYPECVFLGCTATPFRSDKSSMADVLPVCTFTRSIPEMIDAGWLCPVSWRPLRLPVDLSKVKMSMSADGMDYDANEVAALYSPQSAFIVERVKAQVEKRPTVVFAANVEHAYQLCNAFKDVGCLADVIVGDKRLCPDARRAQILHDWKSGHLQYVINVGVLTEGFDYVPLYPNTEGLAAVVIALASGSPSRYLQMLGRGTRLKPGQYKDCLVIDVCGNANLLETKQIVLPKVMPTVSEEELDAFGKGEEPKKKKKVSQKEMGPYTVHINDGEQVSWLCWGCKDGVYYSEIGSNGKLSVTAVLLPDPTGSGLYYARVITRSSGSGYHPASWRAVVEQALPLSECMGHINLLIAQSGNRKLLDKDALWRKGPASEKQLQVLNKATRATAIEQGWNKGEVGLAIGWQFVRPLVEKLKVVLKEGGAL